MDKAAGLLIRDASESDHQAIMDVTLAAYAEYAIVMSPFAWDGYRQNIIATLEGDEQAERIVAEQDGVVVGSVLLYLAGAAFRQPEDAAVAPASPELRLLATPPALRGRGIGAALLEECIRRARRAGVAAITLHTSDMMQTAMQMYERRGFVRAPELDFHPAPEITIKGYRLSLADHDKL